MSTEADAKFTVQTIEHDGAAWVNAIDFKNLLNTLALTMETMNDRRQLKHVASQINTTIT